VRTWRFVDTPGHSEETEDARDGAKADAGHETQRKGEADQGHLVLHGTSLALGLQLTQASLGLFARLGGAVALVLDPRQLLARVAMFVGSLRGCVLPWLSALADVGPLAPHALSHQDRPPQATDARVVRGR
jgi:hypothetical protein